MLSVIITECVMFWFSTLLFETNFDCMSARFSKLVSHSKKYGFFTKKTIPKSNLESNLAAANDVEERSSDGPRQFLTEYGPFGSLMRANLLEQWWKNTITLQDRIFPLSVVDALCDSETNSSRNFNLPRLRALQNYRDFTRNTLLDDEIGIAQLTTLPFDWNQEFSLSR